MRFLDGGATTGETGLGGWGARANRLPRPPAPPEDQFCLIDYLFNFLLVIATI